MNFYKRFIGDYQRKTGHLSICEHGAYALMLDAHYGTGNPLPADRARVCRLIRAITEEEQLAVTTVLEQFWELTEAGWVNKRAIEEIEKARIQAVKNKVIAKAREARKQNEPFNEQSTKRSTVRSTKRATNRSTNVQPIQSQSQSQSPETKTKEDKSKSAHERPLKTNTIPDWYLNKMRNAFRLAGERLVGHHDITEEVIKRQVLICCREINLTFRSDAFRKIYTEKVP